LSPKHANKAPANLCAKIAVVSALEVAVVVFLLMVAKPEISAPPIPCLARAAIPLLTHLPNAKEPIFATPTAAILPPITELVHVLKHPTQLRQTRAVLNIPATPLMDPPTTPIYVHHNQNVPRIPIVPALTHASTTFVTFLMLPILSKIIVQ
jgi:hypothetical protein